MNKLLELIRNGWIEAQLKAPPSVQRLVIPRLHETKEIVRLLARPHLPVYQLQGQGRGGPLMVTYAGLDYAKPDLMSLLFVEEPTEQKIGQIPFWRCRELANLLPSDLLIVEAAKHLIHRLPRRNAIVLPQYVHHILDVSGDWEDVRGRFHKSIRKNELRWIRKYGYEYELSHDQQHFEEFYHRMYLPTMTDRHNELSRPMSVTEAYHYFQQGWLFQVKRQGEWVSGVICHLRQDLLIADILGVKDGDAQLIREGATSATYYAAIHWANEHKYRGVNFLGTGPYLGTGRFQHKRKWGMTITIPPHLHRRIWIRVLRNTPAVSQFLKENPFVIVDKDERLHGLIMVDNPQEVTVALKKEWEENYVTPGLSSLQIRPVSDLTKEEPAKLNDFNLVIPVPVSSHSGDGQ